MSERSEEEKHILIGFGIVFFIMAAILGVRGAALVVVWLVASFIVAGQLRLELAWSSMLPVMAVTAVPFIAFEVLRHGMTHKNDDDAILRDAVEREARRAARYDRVTGRGDQ
jgi:hypothetical protein